MRPLEAVTDMLDAEADDDAADGAHEGREADHKLTRQKLTHDLDEGRIKTEGNQINVANTHECSIFIIIIILISLQIISLHMLLCNFGAICVEFNLCDQTTTPQHQVHLSNKSPLNVLDVLYK